MTFVEHVARRDNPHQVTKAQIGLSNIENYPIATEAEVRAMLRSDRYIDAANTAWIQSALLTYMQEKGLLDSNGALIVAPVDTLGTVVFTITESGVVTITGTHPTAVSVDATLSHATISTLFHDNLTVTATNWTFPTSDLNLDPNITFSLDLVYRDSSGHQISKAHIASKPALVVDNTVFKIERYYDNSGLLSGTLANAAKVAVEVFEDDVSIYVKDDIIVSTNGYWEDAVPVATFDSTSVYTGIATLYAADNTELGVYDAGLPIEAVPDSAIIFTVDHAGTGTLYGSLPGLVTTAVTVTQDNTTVFTNDAITIAPNGSWVADITSITFDPTKTIIATLTATDSFDEEVVLTVEPAVVLPADLVVKMLYDTVRGAWYYDFGHYTDWTTIDPSTILFIDYGLIRNV